MLESLNLLYVSFLAFSKANPVVAGLIGLWGLTILTLIFRTIPYKIFNFIWGQTTTTLSLNSRDDIYYAFLEWVTENKMHSFVRTLNFNNKRWGYGIPIISIGYGTTFFFFDRRLFLVKRSKIEANATSDVKEEIHIILFGRNHNIFYKLFDLIVDSQNKDNFTKIYTWNFKDKNWKLLLYQYKRKLDTVILPFKTKNSIIKHIENFFNDKDWYLNNGIPYRTGILLSGPPGTGKTSLIKALCSEYDKDLYLLSLNFVTDESLRDAISQVPNTAILAIEDIDVAGIENRKKDKIDKPEDLNILTLSGVLNAIDGAASSEDRILVATANSPENLDKALLREGRFDIKEELGYLTDETMRRYLNRFYDFDFSNWSVKEKIAPCLVQKLVFDNRYDPLPVLEKIAYEHSPKTS